MLGALVWGAGVCPWCLVSGLGGLGPWGSGLLGCALCCPVLGVLFGLLLVLGFLGPLASGLPLCPLWVLLSLLVGVGLCCVTLWVCWLCCPCSAVFVVALCVLLVGFEGFVVW